MRFGCEAQGIKAPVVFGIDEGPMPFESKLKHQTTELMKTLTSTLVIAIAALLTSCQTSTAKKDCCKSGAPEKGCCAMKAKASCCDKPGAAGDAHVH